MTFYEKYDIVHFVEREKEEVKLKLRSVLLLLSTVDALLGAQATECVDMSQSEAGEFCTPPYCRDNAVMPPIIDCPEIELNENAVLAHLKGVVNKINLRPILDINKIPPTPYSLKLTDDLFHLFALRKLTKKPQLLDLERDFSNFFLRMDSAHDCFANETVNEYFHVVKNDFEQDLEEGTPCLEKKYNLMLWGSLLCLALSGHWLTPSAHKDMDNLRQRLRTSLKETAKELLNQSPELFRDPVKNEIIAAKNMVSYLNSRGITVKNVKFIVPKTNTVERKINIDVDGNTGFCNAVLETFYDIHLQSQAFQQLQTVLPSRFSIREREENRHSYFQNSIDLRFSPMEPIYTLFYFPGAEPDASGRYRFRPDNREIGWRAYPMWHELGYITYGLSQELLNILSDEDDSTMNMAANMFIPEAEATVKKTLKASIDIAKSVYGENYPTIVHGKPIILKNLQRYLERCCASQKGIAQLLFGNEDEVIQLFGVRLYSETLYVQELCDLRFLAELGLPIKTDRSAVFDSPQDLPLGASHSEKYVDFSNLNLNRDFMSLLFQIHGLDMNVYEDKLKSLNPIKAKINSETFCLEKTIPPIVSKIS